MGPLQKQDLRMEPSHKPPPGRPNSIHTQLNLSLDPGGTRLGRKTERGELALLFTQPLSSMFLLFDHLFGKQLGLLCFYEFGPLVFCTNGYYHDGHKWLSLLQNGEGFCFCCALRLLWPLVCAGVIRLESAACCISIKPSKTVGIYGDAL